MNTCQIQQTTKMLKFVPANNTSLKVTKILVGPSCAQVVHCHNRVHDKTQNLLLFSLKCHPIYPGIHKDPSIGAQT